jgi:hypothetical protein
MNQDERIAELEAKVDQLTQGLEVRSSDLEAVDSGSSQTRRGMLKLAGAAAAGAAAAGAAVAVAGGVQQAAATDGNNLIVGNNNSALSRTYIGYGNFANLAGPTLAANEATMMWVDNRNSPNGGANGLRGDGKATGSGLWGNNDFGGIGVLGGTADGIAVQGSGGKYALVAGLSSVANMRLYPNNDTGTPGPKTPPLQRLDAHVVGEIDNVDGDVWLCVVAGTPGKWRKLGGPASAGAFHVISPSRVYDSRSAAPTPGPLANGANRLVSVADKRDLGTGAVTVANVVPAGATAIAVNVTVANTVNTGFLSVNEGGNIVVAASAINWSSSGQAIANGIIVPVNALPSDCHRRRWRNDRLHPRRQRLLPVATMMRR